ncbi:hypothetical protein ACIBSV_41125 [Embleya sp. NPDC050154]|uniref:hypothetical protein n=1 Tax=Embleya sp. NPDC050154 TaxID=3363988 RepID=UPI0037B0FEF0
MRSDAVQAASRLRGASSLRRADKGMVRHQLASAKRTSGRVHVATNRREGAATPGIAASGFGAAVRIAPARDELRSGAFRKPKAQEQGRSQADQVRQYLDAWWRTRSTRGSERSG